MKETGRSNGAARGARRMEELFAEPSLRRRIAMTLRGIGAPRGSAEYKFARLQLQLSAAPLAAVIIPLLLVGLLLAIPKDAVDNGAAAVAVDVAASEIVEIEPPPPPPDPFTPMGAPEMPSDIPSDAIGESAPDQAANQPLSPKPAEASTALRNRSPFTFIGVAAATRDAGHRGAALGAYGGDAATELAVLRALRYLKSVQTPDGGWDGNFLGSKGNARTRRNVTGFALLAFLSHGETPGRSEEFGETVEKALRYLCSLDDPDYMGAYALIEAYGLTMNPVLREAAMRAMRKWPARIKSNNDVLAGSFMAMALYAAKLGETDFEGLPAMLAAIEADYHGKGESLLKASGRGSWHMSFSAVGLQYLGKHSDPVVGRVVERISQGVTPEPTLGSAPWACCPVRANYFVTMLYFNMGGSVWNGWNAAMKNVYVKGQQVEAGKYEFNGEPHEIGYWRYDDSAGGEQHAGTQPLVSTCYIVQQLMVYYRYLPTFKDPPVKAAAAPAAADADPGEVDVQIEW